MNFEGIVVEIRVTVSAVFRAIPVHAWGWLTRSLRKAWSLVDAPLLEVERRTVPIFLEVFHLAELSGRRTLEV